MMNQPTLLPEQFAVLIARELPRLSREEKLRLIDHCRNWATVYYQGTVPDFCLTQISKLEAQCQY